MDANAGSLPGRASRKRSVQSDKMSETKKPKQTRTSHYRQWLQITLNGAINFIENKKLTEEYLQFVPINEREHIKRFIETAKTPEELKE
jgi:hypothetical protein